MKTKNFILVALICLLFCGCASNAEMRAKYGDGLHLFADCKTGDKYVLKHNLGDNYTLELLEKAK